MRDSLMTTWNNEEISPLSSLLNNLVSCLKSVQLPALISDVTSDPINILLSAMKLVNKSFVILTHTNKTSGASVELGQTNARKPSLLTLVNAVKHRFYFITRQLFSTSNLSLFSFSSAFKLFLLWTQTAFMLMWICMSM